MFNVTDSRDFARALLDTDDFLDLAVDWIRDNLGPENVFDPVDLGDWAFDSGFKEDDEYEGDQQIAERQSKFDAQRTFCAANDYPNFARAYCRICKKSWTEHYTLEEAGSTHITSCPFCNWSWCG